MKAKRPNILLIMADELSAPALPVYGHPIVQAPHLTELASSGAIFDNAYCNYPLCAPSRFSLLAGRLASRIGAFDNASEFPASVPTLCHYLGALGYHTSLSGKMHFIGPDQHHGYHERLTTEIYPSSFAWTPDWSRGEYDSPSGVNLRSVVEAGPCVRSLQIDYDEEVAHFGLQKIYDFARRKPQDPFFLTVSFSHPHPPFTIQHEYWNRYNHEDIDLPSVPPIPVSDLDELSRWRHIASGGKGLEVTEEHVRNARHAYYGMISYIDDKVGLLLNALRNTGLSDDTVVIFTSDHGESLGERGLWYKHVFFEWSVRVPIILTYPGVVSPARYPGPVSLVDLLPTLVDIADPEKTLPRPEEHDGTSWWPALTGENGTDAPGDVIAEYTAEGVRGPAAMLRSGNYKLIYTHGFPSQLYDLKNDPLELADLATNPDFESVLNSMRGRLLASWDPVNIDQRVRTSQNERRLINSASGSIDGPRWVYCAQRGDRHRFIRAAGEVVEAKSRARLPFVEPTPLNNESR